MCAALPLLDGGELVTDARYPERWLNDKRVRRLTAEAHRIFVTTLTWSVANRTDGHLNPRDFDLLPHYPGHAECDELVACGLWDEGDDGLVITVFEETQTSSTQLAGLDRKRLTDRDRQARLRASQRDIARDTEDRTETGQARTGRSTRTPNNA